MPKFKTKSDSFTNMSLPQLIELLSVIKSEVGKHSIASSFCIYFAIQELKEVQENPNSDYKLMH